MASRRAKASDEGSSGEVGPSIRRRRTALGLSLGGLAERSGVSTTMLSEVERGVKNPTVKLAYQIARALGCTLTDLLEEGDVAAVTVVRQDERRSLVDPDTGVTRHGLRSALLGGDMEVIWYELPPGGSTGEMSPNRPGVVELVTVLEGELHFALGGETRTLGAGDTVTYGPQTTCEYRNEHESETCRILMLSDSSKAG